MNKKEYLLTCIGEEASEIIQGVGKAQRFGLDDDFLDESPQEVILREFIELVAVIEMLFGEDIRETILYSAEQIEAKKTKVRKYMKYSEKKGLLE